MNYNSNAEVIFLFYKKCCKCANKFRRPCGAYAVAFGLGMTFSCFCPYGLTMFIVAVIITALGITAIRSC